MRKTITTGALALLAAGSFAIGTVEAAHAVTLYGHSDGETLNGTASTDHIYA